ncbi:MAG: hypothetical protein JSR98_19845 [Proteobacteria bacterium]|nr:hypothetical protein [Pseudomonadota bacterium]
MAATVPLLSPAATYAFFQSYLNEVGGSVYLISIADIASHSIILSILELAYIAILIIIAFITRMIAERSQIFGFVLYHAITFAFVTVLFFAFIGDIRDGLDRRVAFEFVLILFSALCVNDIFWINVCDTQVSRRLIFGQLFPPKILFSDKNRMTMYLTVISMITLFYLPTNSGHIWARYMRDSESTVVNLVGEKKDLKLDSCRDRKLHMTYAGSDSILLSCRMSNNDFASAIIYGPNGIMLESRHFKHGGIKDRLFAPRSRPNSKL